MRKILLFITFYHLLSSVFSQVTQIPEAPSSLSLHLKISNMKSSQTPEVWNNYFILSYFEQYTPRFVAVAFEHEHYQILHKFLLNEHNIFIFYSNLPDVPELRYRINVDGVWQIDPQNSHIVRDPKGVPLSVLQLPEHRNLLVKGPIYRGEGVVDFYLSAKENATVFLVGSFTRWDPFLLPMKEIESGVYHLSVYLEEGEHYYYFLVNGSRMTDPGNFLQKEFLGGSVSAWSTPKLP